MSNERIDLTQFEKDEHNDEYKIEACIGDYTRYMYEDENDIALSKQLNMLPALIDELKTAYEEIDWMGSLVKNLYRLLEAADEDMAYNWAIKYVGKEDMWIVRNNASE